MGRHKKYGTEKALRLAVDGYFDSVSRMVTVYDLVPTGKCTKKGLPMMAQKEALNDQGQVLRRLEYVRPPGLAALCLHLGISRGTWSEYGRDEKLGAVVEYARMRVEDYWNEQLAGKGAQGARFSLSNNCGWESGWKEAREVELGAETRKSVSLSGMSMEEKMALLRSAAAELPEI